MDKKIGKMYKIRALTDHVYGISSSMVMTYLVVGKTSAMVIDTAYGFLDLSQAVRSVTDLPLIVINTHGHVDHSGGNFYFDTPTCIHPADEEVYYRHNAPELHRLVEKTLRSVQHLIFWRTLITKHPEENDSNRANFDRWIFLKDGDRFDLGGLTAEIIHIPGHTPGRVAIFVPELRLLFASDGANAAPYLFLPESTSLSVYAGSLRKLERYDFDYILTGHSSKLFPREELQKWIHVAENADLSTAKKQRNEIAPGVEIFQCWAKDDKKHKGPQVLIDPTKGV